MYVNLFWVWGHPEVYILILPAFGVFSEVIATFSGKPLFGYRSMVAATMAICVSPSVWLHHFFTMGASADVNGVFGVTTMIIAVPTGVQVFNWLFTMYGGRIRFTVPILWSIGFMVTFVIGGMTGVLMAVPPADFQLHNSLFLVAHFHNVIIGGVVFGAMAGYNYWFPKASASARRTLGQGRVLVLAGWLLRRFHAALWARPDGHDPAHAALRRCLLAAMAVVRGGRCRGHPGGHRVPGHPARRVDPRAGRAPRRVRRSMGRPHARMVYGLSAGGLELFRPAQRRGGGHLLGGQEEACEQHRVKAKQRKRASTSRSKCRETARSASSTRSLPSSPASL